MKRTDCITLIICLLSIGIALVAVRCPRTVPYEQCSEVYKRYCNVEGVRATYIQDFRVNDTLTVGVTLLEATDSAGWEYLLQKFNITQEMQTVFQQAGMDVFIWQVRKDAPEEWASTKGENRDTDMTENDLLTCACSLKEGKICVFHTKSKEEMKAIDNYNYDNMINQTNLLDYEENEN